MSAEELNRLLEEGLAREKSWEAISKRDPRFFADFALSDGERLALENPDPGKLSAVGVYPMLAMWGSMMLNPRFSEQMSAGEYFRDITGRK
ncbi:hypothetical protein [Nocardia sp. R6R-6]|uniref:hypothetical protein n=1 Tax=Nocardia sp. R6R-6 TaxID=3459303 RepID=UPI00403D7757